MKCDEIQQAIYQVADDLATYWHQSQCKNPFGRYYLYYYEPRECDMIATFIVTNEDEPVAADGRKGMLASQERLSPAWTRDQAKAFIANAIRKTPCLGGAAKRGFCA